MTTFIRTQAFNSATGCYETIDTEPGNHDDLLNAELSAGDIGCERGATFRLQLVADGNLINERFVRAW